MKLVPKGERLELRLKGPSTTPGYFGGLAATAAAFDKEGFYRMGDALRPAGPDDFTKGFYFDGRIAENFKLATGTWVLVGPVRASLINAMGRLIRDAVIVGENKSKLGALMILSDAAARMAENDLKTVLTKKLTSAAKAATGSAGRVRRTMILTEQPSLDRGEITEKGSLNQRTMRANNSDLITRLYSGGEGVITA